MKRSNGDLSKYKVLFHKEFVKTKDSEIKFDIAGM